MYIVDAKKNLNFQEVQFSLYFLAMLSDYDKIQNYQEIEKTFSKN